MNSRKKMLMNLSESLESNLNREGMNFSFCSARIAEAAKMETKGHFLLAWLPDSLNVSGIVYGWLPVGVAIQNNKPAKSLSGGSRITYIVSPRKVYEVTGHVWRGKEALKKKNKTDEHIEE